ncbi:hypothetical protein N9X61_00185 [Sulfurimonas sp.]|nr:hypothetical protein [Sulfurimonas sp.]
MNPEELEQDLKTSYKPELSSIEERVNNITHHIINKYNLVANDLSTTQMQVLSATILNIETKTLHDEVEALHAQKEQLERKIEKQSHALQDAKYTVFNALESQLSEDDTQALAKLHQIKLQTIDLYDILGEIVESAIITALEKDIEIDDTIMEVIKDITFEAIKEGSLNTIRIRKILSTILQSSIEIAEASPVQAQKILAPTLKGMRAGLIHAITRFKQRLIFIPIEAKHILIEDYDTIIEDLNQTDSLFAQVIQTQADSSSSAIKISLDNINKDMKYDLDELLRISKDTAEVMKERFSSLASKTMKKADEALKSQKAVEAKKMGKQALEIAKSAIDSAVQSAKNAIDKK